MAEAGGTGEGGRRIDDDGSDDDDHDDDGFHVPRFDGSTVRRTTVRQEAIPMP